MRRVLQVVSEALWFVFCVLARLNAPRLVSSRLVSSRLVSSPPHPLCLLLPCFFLAASHHSSPVALSVFLAHAIPGILCLLLPQRKPHGKSRKEQSGDANMSEKTAMRSVLRALGY